MGFMDMFRLLKPILVSWSYAYPELALVETLNQTRIQAAHARGLEQVSYKGRSPFTDADCLAEMYLDVFTIRKCMRKFRDKAVTRTSEILRRYIDRYGPGLC